MAGNFTYIVKLQCNLAIFYCSFGLFFCGTFDTNRCPGNLPKDQYQRVHGDKCYRFITSEVSWTAARDHCSWTGGQLISIKRRDIQLFVERTLHELWPINGMWIGANDRDSEMNWFWVTGEKVDSGFQNWESGQPSCYLFLCYEDCACLRVDMRFKWHDKLCSSNYGFACEYNLLPIPKASRGRTATKSTTTTAVATTTLPLPPPPITSTTTPPQPPTTTTTTTTASTAKTTTTVKQLTTCTETTENEKPTTYTKRTTLVKRKPTPTRVSLSFWTGPDTSPGVVMTKQTVTGIIVGTLTGVIIIVIVVVMLTIIIQRRILTSRFDKRLTNTQQISKDRNVNSSTDDRNKMVIQAKTQVSDRMKMAESAYDYIDDYYYIDIDHTDGSVHAYKDLQTDAKCNKILQTR